jgi:MoaA/NifB/PqqE/SkfB family radical SAM enzyme
MRYKPLREDAASSPGNLRRPERFAAPVIVYQIYRVVGPVSKVIQNLEAILAECRKQRKRFRFVELQYIVFLHNRQEMPQVRELAHRLGVDRLTFIQSQARTEAMAHKGKPVQPDKCNVLWLMACFNWNGSFSPWCDSVDDSFGNIFEQDFDALWNSERIIKSRSLHTSQPILSEPATKCSRCRIYRGCVTFLPQDGASRPAPASDQLVAISLNGKESDK